MKFVKKKAAELKPAKYNPRKDLKPGDLEFEQIRKSIQKFGYVDPIIYNKRTGHIVGGHQRFKVMLDEGKTEFDVVEVDLNETDEKALNVALNKISGEWDDALLKDLMDDLAANDYDIAITGFNTEEIAELMEQFQEEEPQDPTDDDFDVEENISDERITRRGDIWEIGRHRLLCGDSTDAKDIKNLMNGEKAQLLFTSPPYSDMRDYNGNKNLEVGFISDFINAYRSYTDYQAINLGIQRKDGEIYEYWNEFIKKGREAGYKLLSWNVWNKMMAGSVGNQSAFFSIVHEWIFVFGTETFELNKFIKKKESSIIEGEKIRSIRQKDGSTVKRAAGNTSEPYKKPESVLNAFPEFGEIRYEHPANFPINLPYDYVQAITNKNDNVIEPFGGSGTTLIACEQLGQNCYMMELDETYCDVIVNRYINFSETEGADVFLIRNGEKIPFRELKEVNITE